MSKGGRIIRNQGKEVKSGLADICKNIDVYREMVNY
jgi:hypothetical protein